MINYFDTFCYVYCKRLIQKHNIWYCEKYKKSLIGERFHISKCKECLTEIKVNKV